MPKLQGRSICLVNTISRLVNRRRSRAHIDISVRASNEATQVLVSLTSHVGTMEIAAYANDTSGNAYASLRASSLAHIAGLRVVDRRAD